MKEVPDIRMVYIGNHSPVRSVVLVETRIGTVAVPGDAMYDYRNPEYD